MVIMVYLESQPVTTAEAHVSLLETLRDIATNVEIQADFRIKHPDYQIFELPQEMIDRLVKMPDELQGRYWTMQLRSFLYGIYYNGSMRSALAPGVDAESLYMNMENNSFLGVDPAFFERLHTANTGTGHFDPGWMLIRQEADGQWAVRKGELVLHVTPTEHLQVADQTASVGDPVAIRMPKNFFQNGFYMAVGNAGVDSHQAIKQTVRIYFNLSPEGAVAMMRDLTQALNDLALSFTFKVLYNPQEYGRHDSGVLYFEKGYYEQVRSILEKLYRQHQEHFGADVPLFTKVLAPGLSTAEEPNQKFSEQESFGLNRCHIIAQALLQARAAGDESSDIRLAMIQQLFGELGLLWEKPYLNANSEDIYQTFAIA
jgi:hypothetical protein